VEKRFSSIHSYIMLQNVSLKLSGFIMTFSKESRFRKVSPQYLHTSHKKEEEEEEERKKKRQESVLHRHILNQHAPHTFLSSGTFPCVGI
jgi:hypothetical protein